MKSITTKKNSTGWNYTFKKRSDGTIIIQQKNSGLDIHREIRIFGDEELTAFKKVIFW